MTYTTESSVYNTTGLSSEIIQKLAQISESDVSTLVSGWISDAEQDIKTDLGLPFAVIEELHLGDGNNNLFELGPWDEEYGAPGQYDPTDCVEKVYRVKFHRAKKLLPYPTTCELGTESITGWTGSNATITADTSSAVAGDARIKAVFSSAGYIRYPDGSNVEYLDVDIDKFKDWFANLELSDKTATITLRLYDKDGNYNHEEITLRQNNIDEFIWIDLNSMDGSVDWDDVRLQYIELHVDKACTLYVDNMCFADEWAYTAPKGYFHVSVAHNVSSESPPPSDYPFYVSYTYDPFKASVPSNIRQACDWLVGIKIIDYLRTVKYINTDFRLLADTMMPDDIDTGGTTGVLGVKHQMLQNYNRCIQRYGQGSYGLIV